MGHVVPNLKTNLFLICLLAFILRLIPALENRFHPDEALFSTWAMHVASGRNVLLNDVPVDKPPLAIYTMAASLALLRRSEVAARVPNLIASVISVLLVWMWARDLTSYPPRRGGEVVAALVMALSPFNIAFGGTAFLDPLMVMWGLAACVAAARGRGGWAGLLLGLAFATKVQGVLFVPLVLLSLVFGRGTQTHNAGNKIKSVFIRVYTYTCKYRRPNIIRFLIGCAVPVLFVLLWDRARGGTPFWVQQAINYGGIRFAFANELTPRLVGWLELLSYFLGPVLGVMLLAGSALLLINVMTGAGRTRAAIIDMCLITYTVGFITLHWLLSFPIWDRYLLSLVPVAALLLGRMIDLLVARLFASHSQLVINLRHQLIMLGVVGALLLPYSIQVPVGGDHGPHDGMEQVEMYLRGLPVGTVIYDHWLGWELDFYLWDAGLFRAYFKAPSDLARDLRVFGRASTRYIVVPASESIDEVERAITKEGFSLLPVLQTTDRFALSSFVVFEIASK